jgi:hypothetical protein
MVSAGGGRRQGDEPEQGGGAPESETGMAHAGTVDQPLGVSRADQSRSRSRANPANAKANAKANANESI